MNDLGQFSEGLEYPIRQERIPRRWRRSSRGTRVIVIVVTSTWMCELKRIGSTTPASVVGSFQIFWRGCPSAPGSRGLEYTSPCRASSASTAAKYSRNEGYANAPHDPYYSPSSASSASAIVNLLRNEAYAGENASNK